MRSILLLGIVSCVGPDDGTPGDGSNAADDSAATDDTGSDSGGSGAWGDDVYGLVGTITWSVDFADDTQDCSYSRTYAATEDWSEPWTCPDCVARFQADAVLDGVDCYQMLTGTSDVQPVEYLGVGADGSFHRTTYANYPLVEQGTAELEGDTITIHNEDEADDGSYSLAVDGTLERSHSDVDPWNGFVPPDSYACGWPKADPAPFDGAWELTDGGTVPDGWFKDTCDEVVRLQDFADGYFIVDVAATDCGPCQSMATDEPAFEEDMAAQGITVHVVTLMSPSLSAILDDTPTSVLQKWTDYFGLSGPVLADRGWGYAILGTYLGKEGFGYPAWAVVSPDLRVILVGSGYGAGLWDEIGAAIEADQ
jgi:thiol-disulfide isomerase/thioredoxin